MAEHLQSTPKTYALALAAAHGLAVQHVDRQTLRHDQGQAVGGLLMRLARDNVG